MIFTLTTTPEYYSTRPAAPDSNINPTVLTHTCM